MKLDPNFYYHSGLSGGRTTKMILKAIELAKEPQQIVLLGHNQDGAEIIFHHAMSILDENAPELGHLSYIPEIERPNRQSRRYTIKFPAIGSVIYFLWPHVDAKRFVIEHGATSILIDHCAAERYAEMPSGGTAQAFRYWLGAIDAIQTMNADKEIKA